MMRDFGQQLELWETLPNESFSVEYCAEYDLEKQVAHLLAGNLDFHDNDGTYAPHNFHSFPAKFPPQLPRIFIQHLTAPGDVVLDPMMGSGTTILEAIMADRRAVGVDLDPLAVLISSVKTTPLDPGEVHDEGKRILTAAWRLAHSERERLVEMLSRRWDQKTRDFIDYWFAPETQIELIALVSEIEKTNNTQIRAFFELVFSAVIITKSGGVSMALDLAHTRPHKAKVVIGRHGEIFSNGEVTAEPSERMKLLTKTLRSPLEEFEKRYRRNISGLLYPGAQEFAPMLLMGNSQYLPIQDESVDLVISSPPYASNAIDYMRAHKFSLIWLGHSIENTTRKRKSYIGGEIVEDALLVSLPPKVHEVIEAISCRDMQKSRVLHRYYSEMKTVLSEIYRVLRPRKVAILVVGSSVMRGIDTETGECLAEIGRSLGFTVPRFGVRNLDRNRRMLPAGSLLNLDSRIQQRMHEEFVVGFIKPASSQS